MAEAYEIHAAGTPSRMTPVICKNEESELQNLLDSCPALMPGDQIDPENPRRWLLIQREMSVPSPSTGSDHWNIDFLYADQDAIPTFVEVKRFADTRSRREVIGQMFEYAANGQYYWTADKLQQAAEKSSLQRGKTLATELRDLQPLEVQDADDYFNKLGKNLRESRIRLVFFLEKAPQELKSLVEFLNRQLMNIEVLLIEAQIFEDSTHKRFVIPRLFGYIEQTRKIQALVESGNVASRSKTLWNESGFFKKAQEALTGNQAVISALRDMYAFGQSKRWVEWSSGTHGAFNFRERRLSDKVFMTLRADGKLQVSFGSLLNTSDAATKALKFLVNELTSLGFSVPADAVSAPRWPSFKCELWLPKKDQLIQILQRLYDDVEHMPSEDLQSVLTELNVS